MSLSCLYAAKCLQQLYNNLSRIIASMEEDEEIIKKLMSMLGAGKELKFKSANGQVIKVSFEGSSYNETESGSQKCALQSPQQEEPQAASIASNLFGEELTEMAQDFIALGKIEEQRRKESSEEELEPFHLPYIDKIDRASESNRKQEDSSRKDDSLIKKLTLPEKPRKILLTAKQARRENDSVISFFKDEHYSVSQDSLSPLLDLRPLPASSPLISRIREDESSMQRAETVKQSINRLKELHPESQTIVELIRERVDELEEIQKSISLINSSISNSLSMGFESFDVSMLSFSKGVSDPLCHLMAQFISKAKEVAGSDSPKSVPSSFLFMFSQPLVDLKRGEALDQIDYFEEEQIVEKILKDGKCKVDYIHVPATLEKFHEWIAKGVEIIHFCGHGLQTLEENILVFENQSGESVRVGSNKLSELLLSQRTLLKLVFVASCHSESAGRVFFEAGATHVICVRDEYKILDEACHEFVKVFYLTCINTSASICEAFEFAKKQLVLGGKFSRHECQKFIIIASHHRGLCEERFQRRDQTENFNDLSPRPEHGKIMLSRVEHYISRGRQLYEVIQLIQKKRRFITIVGQSGLGKSTLVRELARHLQCRNYFQDGIVYLQLSRCQTMAKVFEVLDLEFFEASQLRLNKTPVENALKLSKYIGEKKLLLIFDNCQAIMASEEKETFNKLSEVIMKNCINVTFIFTNRYSIGRQIDFCSEVLYELCKLTETQSKALFFKKAPREINRKEYDEFFKIDALKNIKQVSEHSFFQFLNGHPEAICLTASLLAERTLSELHQLLLEPNISAVLNSPQELAYSEGINRVVATAMKISLNVIHHKYKESSEMIKILSLLPNGLESEMMQKLFPHGGRWKENVRRLINHSLVQCIEKAGCRYYLAHPQIITEVEGEIGTEEKIRLHERVCAELVQRINKIYKFVGTSSQYSQRAQQLFLNEEDNYRAIFLRELSFIGEKYPLRKFYENLFRFECEGLDEEEKDDFGQRRISNADILSLVESKKKRSLQLEKNVQKKESIDLLIVYYLTIVFIIRKVKSAAIEGYLNYGFLIGLKRGKYLVVANLLRIKACIFLSQGADADAKAFFQVAHAEFAQLGCGLGSACCEAALGYMKLYECEYAQAKKNLENALKYYEEIPHPFGKHYLNRWLCSLKSKMNKQQRQLINHKLEAQKLLKETKENLRSNNLNHTSFVKHKFGYFAFRFLLDNISLFLEATFEVDLRPKFINPTNKRNERAFNEKTTNNIILEDIYFENNEQQFQEMTQRKNIVSDAKPNFSLFTDNEDHTVLKSIIKSASNNKKELKGINVVSAKPSVAPKLAKEEQTMPQIRASLSNSVAVEKSKAKKYTSKLSLLPQGQQQRSFK